MIVQTPWAGAVFTVMLTFSEDYPAKPPAAVFTPTIFHPNIFPNGYVCLSILKEDVGWVPAIGIKQVLLGIQELLDTPNFSSIAQWEAHNLYKASKIAYLEKIKSQTIAFTPKD
jgi:ubiquitin-conjugating enzyme E2 I